MVNPYLGDPLRYALSGEHRFFDNAGGLPTGDAPLTGTQSGGSGSDTMGALAGIAAVLSKLPIGEIRKIVKDLPKGADGKVALPEIPGYSWGGALDQIRIDPETMQVWMDDGLGSLTEVDPSLVPDGYSGGYIRGFEEVLGDLGADITNLPDIGGFDFGGTDLLPDIDPGLSDLGALDPSQFGEAAGGLDFGFNDMLGGAAPWLSAAGAGMGFLKSPNAATGLNLGVQGLNALGSVGGLGAGLAGWAGAVAPPIAAMTALIALGGGFDPDTPKLGINARSQFNPDGSLQAPSWNRADASVGNAPQAYHDVGNALYSTLNERLKTGQLDSRWINPNANIFFEFGADADIGLDKPRASVIFDSGERSAAWYGADGMAGGNEPTNRVTWSPQGGVEELMRMLQNDPLPMFQGYTAPTRPQSRNFGSDWVDYYGPGNQA